MAWSLTVLLQLLVAVLYLGNLQFTADPEDEDVCYMDSDDAGIC